MSQEDDVQADAINEALVGLGTRVLERPALVKEQTEYTGKTSGTKVGITSQGLSSGGADNAESGVTVTGVDANALQLGMHFIQVVRKNGRARVRIADRKRV